MQLELCGSLDHCASAIQYVCACWSRDGYTSMIMDASSPLSPPTFCYRNMQFNWSDQEIYTCTDMEPRGCVHKNDRIEKAVVIVAGWKNDLVHRKKRLMRTTPWPWLWILVCLPEKSSQLRQQFSLLAANRTSKTKERRHVGLFIRILNDDKLFADALSSSVSIHGGGGNRRKTRQLKGGDGLLEHETCTPLRELHV